jgi:hypothetical protein
LRNTTAKPVTANSGKIRSSSIRKYGRGGEAQEHGEFQYWRLHPDAAMPSTPYRKTTRPTAIAAGPTIRTFPPSIHSSLEVVSEYHGA